MYGDTAIMRRRAGQLREQAVDVRAMADQLVAQAETIDWQGRAADALRERMRSRAEHLRASAHRHDDAAQALDRHLVEVGRRQDTIAELESRASIRIDEARGRVEAIEAHQDPDGIVREATDADRALLDFTPPPSGHKDWLTVELPGS